MSFFVLCELVLSVVALSTLAAFVGAVVEVSAVVVVTVADGREGLRAPFKLALERLVPGVDTRVNNKIRAFPEAPVAL